MNNQNKDDSLECILANAQNYSTDLNKISVFKDLKKKSDKYDPTNNIKNSNDDSSNGKSFTTPIDRILFNFK